MRLIQKVSDFPETGYGVCYMAHTNYKSLLYLRFVDGRVLFAVKPKLASSYTRDGIEETCESTIEEQVGNRGYLFGDYYKDFILGRRNDNNVTDDNYVLSDDEV